jgi:hypothetical protein
MEKDNKKRLASKDIFFRRVFTKRVCGDIISIHQPILEIEKNSLIGFEK